MFQSPLLLLLLLLIPWIAHRLRYQGRHTAINFSSTSVAKTLTPTWRQRLAWLPSTLWLTGLALLIISLAGPREGRQQISSDSEGIAIEMVVDRSDSMRAMDFQIEEEPVDRLTAVKDVVSKFVLGEGKLDGRDTDLIGLVSFAGVADGLCPPTLDHSFVVSQLNAIQMTDRRNESGTAIGDALALAVEKLTALDNSQDEKIKSKIIILLTDGENNAGDLQPLEAAELAKIMKFKVYTIGVGTHGQAPVPFMDPFSQRQVLQWVDVRIDEASLKEIADVTGGKYFRATDTQSLEQIYAEIDQMEKTTVKENKYVDYRELAVQPIQWNGFAFPPLALSAFALICVQLVLKFAIFREFA